MALFRIERAVLIFVALRFVNLMNVMNGIDWMTAAKAALAPDTLAPLGRTATYPCIQHWLGSHCSERCLVLHVHSTSSRIK